MTQISSPITTSEDRISDYVALLKPKVMSLVVFTGFAGMFVAPGFAALHPVMIFTAMLSLALGAGAAGAINMWYDRDIDSVMSRTKTRPVPMGRVPGEEALSLGVVMSLLSIMTMALAVNYVAAGILAFSILFYALIYTVWLKRHTPQNIVIGGAAGAFPPVIGWAAVTGDVTLYPVILFLIIFLWTPPHFWALALFSNADYKAANIPMLPCVAGERMTKIQMLAYTMILLPTTLAPYVLGYTGIGYGVTAFVLSVFFVFIAWRTLLDKTHKSAKLMFSYSVFYLFALFLGLMIDKV